MALDVVPAADRPVSDCWLYKCDDCAPFAYARGEEFIRYADHARWARLHDDWLVSERSGARLAYRAGNLFYDAVSHEPLYYQPPWAALSAHRLSGEISAVRATRRASPHRTANRSHVGAVHDHVRHDGPGSASVAREAVGGD